MYEMFICLALMLLLLVRSAAALAAAKAALVTCAELIVPSLFPFFVISMLLNRLGLPSCISRIFRCGRSVSAFITGVCGGFPLGAASIADMYKRGELNESEAETALCWCSNCGVSFMLGAVGSGVFGSSAVGIRLCAVNIISALAVKLLLGGREKAHYDDSLTQMSLSEALPEAVTQAVGAVLNVCGFVVSFTVLSKLLNISAAAEFLSLRTGFDAAFLNAFFSGILEIGSGAAALRSVGMSREALALAAFMTGFGGLSVYCQTLAVLKKAKLKGTLYFQGRLLAGSIAAVIMYLLPFQP